jgi:hypothetical protein
VLVVDDEEMAVPPDPIPQHGITEMGMVFGQIIVGMIDDIGVVGRPKGPRRNDAEQPEAAEHDHGNAHIEGMANPSGQGVGDEPAGVG